MIWKLFLLYFTNYVSSIDGFLIPFEEHPSTWPFIESSYDTQRSDLPDEDVGTPLILTPYIKDQKLMEARQAARVNDTVLLPGIESYAGYLTVNKKFDGNLWFWYFPVSNRNLKETPLIIWLQGGPGASSLFGLFKEIGPFTAVDNQTLKENKYSWGKNHSLLFIDNPVGTGFSFTDFYGYTTKQTEIGEQLYNAVQQFLTIFSELRTAPIFIAGESYAGKHIPSLAIQILRQKIEDKPINLQGLSIGNGFIDPVTLQRYSYFLREVGLVDDNTANIIKLHEDNIKQAIQKNETRKAFNIYSTMLRKITTEADLNNIYNYLQDEVKLYDKYTKFVQTPAVRRALHVGNTTFSRAGLVYYSLMPDFMNSAKPWLEELLNNYRVLVYSGHLDCIVPYPASIETYKSLNYSGANEYRKAERIPWHHDDKLAGYYKIGGYLTEVMVRGAGHMVPYDQPAPALALISAFIQNLTLNNTRTPL